MIRVKVEKGIDQALKVLKRRVRDSKQNQSIRERKEYTKPSVKRRSEIIKAKYVQRIKTKMND